jgi:hypothetical protein
MSGWPPRSTIWHYGELRIIVSVSHKCRRDLSAGFRTSRDIIPRSFLIADGARIKAIIWENTRTQGLRVYFALCLADTATSGAHPR